MTEPSRHDSSDEYREHIRRIAVIVDYWRRGGITVSQKRAQNASENASYYGGNIRSPVTGEPLCVPPKRGDPSVSILADAHGVPFEAMAAALTARRQSNYTAANVDTMDEAKEILNSGQEAYCAILKAARPGRVPESAAPQQTQETMDW